MLRLSKVAQREAGRISRRLSADEFRHSGGWDECPYEYGEEPSSPEEASNISDERFDCEGRKFSATRGIIKLAGEL